MSKGTVAFSATRTENDQLVTGIELEVMTSSAAPAQDREIFKAVSADDRIVLLTAMDSAGDLHFSLESTALQALMLASVREDPAPFFEVYHYGARPGDLPNLDQLVPAVTAEIRQHLLSTGRTGLFPTGFADPATGVFGAIDPSIAAPSVGAPRARAPASAAHLGILELDGSSGQVALWTGAYGPLPHLPIPSGTTRIGFFFYTVPVGPSSLYARMRLDDGRQTPASNLFSVQGEVPEVPDAPALSLEGEIVRACGGSAGNWIVFFNSSTELAVGFAARRVGPDGACVTLPRAELPPDTWLLRALQVSPDLRVGSPGNALFP